MAVVSVLAFYLVYNYGHYTWEETPVFNSPLQCIFDTILVSVGDILIPYENLLHTDYNIVGKVRIKGGRPWSAQDQ